jgi:hypothetical protein
MKKLLSKLNIKNIFLIIVLGILVVGTLIGGTYGYYIHKNQSDGYVEATNFYFDSDYLVEGGKIYNLNVDTKSITFEVRNFADSLRFCENDLTYEITASAGSLDIKSGKLDRGKKSSQQITLSGLENGKEYTVTATASDGFTKTLSATFKVREVENKFYKNVSENDPYIILTIWTENISGEVTIDFPEGLIPDNTCSGMENVKTNDGKFTVDCGSYSSFEFRFFKDSSYDSAKDFTVILTSNGINIEALNKEIK